MLKRNEADIANFYPNVIDEITKKEEAERNYSKDNDCIANLTLETNGYHLQGRNTKIAGRLEHQVTKALFKNMHFRI